MAADIFVSFASRDVRVAMTLCRALESRGFACWISARDVEPGANVQAAIVRALRQAKVMLLVFTANSNVSEEMTRELALASQSKMIVIPLRVEDVTPNDAFTDECAPRQWIDVFADWEAAIDQLSRRVGQALLDRTSARAGAAADAAKPAAPEPPAEAGAPVETAIPAAAPAAPVRAGDPSVEAADAAADDELPAPAPPADAPAREAPIALLIGAAVAVLAVVGIAIALAGHGGSKAATAQAPAGSSPVGHSVLTRTGAARATASTAGRRPSTQ